MRGPTRVFWANLTPFLAEAHRRCPDACEECAAVKRGCIGFGPDFISMSNAPSNLMGPRQPSGRGAI
jgi:hypothetical protein